MKINANAKINLYLDVLSKRFDGYHNIQTIMQEIDLADQIEITPNDSGKIRLKVTGKFAVSPNATNIVYKACKLTKNTFNIQNGVNIHLQKNIPIGAGLGGGSSDAAATLKALCSLWNISVSHKKLIELGTYLGADVPFFINGGRAFAEGIGEKLTPIKNYKKMNIVLVYPNLNISTKQVYEKLSLNLTKPNKKVTIKNLFNRDITDKLYNKFESFVFKVAPKVKKIKHELITLGADAALMSGSGSCVFGIVSSDTLAKSIKEQISDTHKKYSVWNLNTL